MPLPPSGSSPATADDHAGNSKKFPQSPPFRSLPDPFAELLAIERTERIDMKDKLGPNTMSRMSHIRRHARCRNAIRQWHAVMLVQRRRERLARAKMSELDLQAGSPLSGARGYIELQSKVLRPPSSSHAIAFQIS